MLSRVPCRYSDWYNVPTSYLGFGLLGSSPHYYSYLSPSSASLCRRSLIVALFNMFLFLVLTSTFCRSLLFLPLSIASIASHFFPLFVIASCLRSSTLVPALPPCFGPFCRRFCLPSLLLSLVRFFYLFTRYLCVCFDALYNHVWVLCYMYRYLSSFDDQGLLVE